MRIFTVILTSIQTYLLKCVKQLRFLVAKLVKM